MRLVTQTLQPVMVVVVWGSMNVVGDRCVQWWLGVGSGQCGWWSLPQVTAVAKVHQSLLLIDNPRPSKQRTSQAHEFGCPGRGAKGVDLPPDPGQLLLRETQAAEEVVPLLLVVGFGGRGCMCEGADMVAACMVCVRERRK